MLGVCTCVDVFIYLRQSMMLASKGCLTCDRTGPTRPHVPRPTGKGWLAHANLHDVNKTVAFRNGISLGGKGSVLGVRGSLPGHDILLRRGAMVKQLCKRSQMSAPATSCNCLLVQDAEAPKRAAKAKTRQIIVGNAQY